ncbi:DEAD/DEAH box helicase family protein [Nesterenkonia alkaliphila]|uniref:DUF4145 domain-containing protein n=1 Tax=Nesterenkonia alkaliphila TaxID=1463631 RepID=A0A7K1UKI1_9MICC|nr:DEAD/DEAH box helicase family protein [Nesterenkonia alkaliphila]MVT26980.1 DUF4145 domain-containing protein [Nesterenkonia alkaliphila]GFZ90180.1 restriction endonuclease subunit R [Nesterenkonia alkaliphila]
MPQSNFAFIATEWPQIYEYALRAEEYIFSDPKAAGVYARNAAEELVYYIFALKQLRQPQDNNLAGHLQDPDFSALAPRAIRQKIDLLRKRGNRAAHPGHKITTQDAHAAVTDLHHVLIWAAHTFSTQPDTIPLDAEFDPKIATSRTPMRHEELRKLAVKVQQEHEEFQRKLEESAAASRAKDEEIARLQTQLAAAQAAKTTEFHRDLDEATTRTELIDEMLAEAGWVITKEHTAGGAQEEVPLRGPDGETRYADYVLWDDDGTPLAVIEAKRTSRSESQGQEQALLYAEALEAQYGVRPIIFCTNGLSTLLWEESAGYPPRPVLSFLTKDELQWRHHTTRRRRPLSDQPVKSQIVDRPYQERVIRSVGETFSAKHRAALLVMATGTGKTRTVIALVEQMLQAGWVKRVLFLADRKALVRQAVNAFRDHLPEQPPVNLLEEKDPDGRIYVSTYPTMLNQIEQYRQDGSRLYGPGFFDLVIVDEAHRSVYQKYRSIFEWFDSVLLGLTATPVDQVDRNTYQLFGQQPGVPTDAYSLDEAIADGYLVPARGLSIGTEFLSRGVRYDELSEEEKDTWDQLEWDEDGEIPDQVAASEMNRRLFNTDTVDKVLAELFEHGIKVAGGDVLGKTIIFAINQRHADFIDQRFNLQYPEHAGRFARVITSKMEHSQRLIDAFGSRQPVSEPQIAITVDMLDTGIDVPEVVNLVFFKQVFSKTKFWQMVGRGTRKRPELFGPGAPKTEFLILDAGGNLEFFNADVPEPERTRPKSLSERLFQRRLELLTALDTHESGGTPDLLHHKVPMKYDDAGHSPASFRADLVHSARVHVAGMNPQNVQVRPHRALVERFSEPEAWEKLTHQEALELAERLGRLPSESLKEAEEAKSFDLTVLRAQLAQVTGDGPTLAVQRNRVQDIAESLLAKTHVPEVKAQAALLEEIREDTWWEQVTYLMLETVRRRLRGLTGFADKTRWKPVQTDFEDTLLTAEEVALRPITPGTDPAQFRLRAERFLRQNVDNLAVQKLRHNKQLTEQDLRSLEQLLVEAGLGTREDIRAVTEDAQGLGVFIRSLVGLDQAAAQAAFAGFTQDTNFTADQLHFINQIIGYLTANGVMEPAQLFDSPFSDYGQADQIIGEEGLAEVVDILSEIRNRAQPPSTDPSQEETA